MMTAADARASERSANALIEAWYASWNAHDVVAAQNLLAADAVLEEPDAPDGGHRGPEAIGAWMSTWLRACPDMHLDEHQRWVSADGSTVATWFTVRGTFSGPLDPPGFAPTNAAIEVAGMDRTEIRDGLVARHQIFYDTTTVARQIGAAPQPGTISERIAVRLQRWTARGLRRQQASPAARTTAPACSTAPARTGAT
jgi:steroid delta-isomerase-like uncharacterized protein